MGGKQAGWEHFARADWAAARDAFAAALDDEPEDPEALDGLGQSLWWLGERDAQPRLGARLSLTRPLASSSAGRHRA